MLRKGNFYFLMLRGLLIFLLLPLLVSCSKDKLTYEPQSSTIANVSHAKSTFVGVDNCKECHEAEYKLWKGSHHDDAMKVADSMTVKGDFNNVNFSSNGVKYFFFKNEDKFYVNTQDGDGVYKDFKIDYTFGVTPLQQYLIAFPDGAYQTLHAAWDDQELKWFDVQARYEIDTAEWLHWTRGAGRWNAMCADCHSTNVHENFDLKTQKYDTKFSEINVACESCHGPGSEHVDFYKKGKEGVPPKFYMTKDMVSTELVDKCARCHSRRGQMTKYFDYTGEFLDHYDPALLTHDIYELDGQIMDEDYVYASFLQSKMYHNGVSCRDCHDVHSLKLKKQGNALCLQCHVPSYDTKEHHKHKINTEASLCINCHMDGKVYMGNDYRRDHSFRVPRPDQSVKYGTTNACNQCHQDKSAAWASDFIVQEYGDTRPEHFSDLFMAGFEGDQAKMYELISNPKYPAIARSTAMHYYGQTATIDEVRKIARFLTDTAALMRAQTTRTLKSIPSLDYKKAIRPLLEDPVRLVRVNAAQYMAIMDTEISSNPAYQQAMKESMESLEMQADFASGQYAMAVYYEQTGKVDEAIKAYEQSITIDNHYNLSRMNLALLKYRKGQIEEAKALYQKVIEQEPNYSNAYYMLGLLYHELGDSSESMKYFEQAINTESPNPRAFYNYATLLLQAKSLSKVIAVAAQSQRIFGMQEEMVYLQMLAEIEIPDAKAAIKSCRQLIALAPNNPEYQNILNQLLAQE